MHSIFNTFKARYYPNDVTYTFDHFWKANIFVFNQEDEMPIIYPLIEGKLYLRQNSNSIYYFNGEELVGTKDLTIVQTSNNVLNPVVKNGTAFTIQPPVGVAEAVTAEDEEFEYENEKVYLLQTETCYVKFIFTRSALFGNGDELLVDLDYKKVTVDGEERVKLYNKNGNMPFFSVPYVTAMIAFYTSLGATLNSSSI